MASDKPEKREKKDKKEKKEKKEKSDKVTDGGIKKSKSEKKEKKKNTEALEAELERSEIVVPVNDDAVEVDGAVSRPVGALVPFANPLADEKQTKKLLKSVKKAAKNKTLKRGVKEVVKSLRKSPITGPTSGSVSDPIGVVIIAADISPMDVISHIPVLCEDHNIPYIYVSSRAELGAAGNTKRATSVVMVAKDRIGKAKAGEEGDSEYPAVYSDLVKLTTKAAKSVRV